MKKNVVVLFGGASSEHEVSRNSCLSILKNLNEEKYNVLLVGITKKGEWYLYSGDIENISSNAWENDVENKKTAFISPSTGDKGLYVFNDGKFETIHVDVIFPVLHGKNGEDGTIQGLFELAQIPYVGCDVLSSCCCMDKIFTNIVLTSAGIIKAKFAFIESYDYEKNPSKCIEHIENQIQLYPMFVKPSNAGSSVGISKVNNRNELIDAISLAQKHDTRILIEENIIGQEVASVVGEIAPSNEFYDYEAKYVSDSKLYIPAHISEETSNKIREIAKKAFKTMSCKGLARIDFFVQNTTNEIYLNEINTLPGFTSTGIPYSELLDRVINLALERFNKNEK